MAHLGDGVTGLESCGIHFTLLEQSWQRRVWESLTRAAPVPKGGVSYPWVMG